MSLKQLFRFDNCVQLIAERLFFRGTHLQVHRINGVECLVDHRAADAGSIRQCIATDAYRQFTWRLKLPPNPVVVDIGANVGGFSLMLLVDGVKPKSLTAVEMNPQTYERLRFNILHNFPEAEVVNAAVVGHAREVLAPTSIGSTNDNIYSANGNGRTIPGVTLDSLLGTERVDLLKIDIEGAEREVLAGECSSLDRVENLIIELHPVKHYDELCAAIASHGLTLIANDGADRRGVHWFARHYQQ